MFLWKIRCYEQFNNVESCHWHLKRSDENSKIFKAAMDIYHNNFFPPQSCLMYIKFYTSPQTTFTIVDKQLRAAIDMHQCEWMDSKGHHSEQFYVPLINLLITLHCTTLIQKVIKHVFVSLHKCLKQLNLESTVWCHFNKNNFLQRSINVAKDLLQRLAAYCKS